MRAEPISFYRSTSLNVAAKRRRCGIRARRMLHWPLLAILRQQGVIADLPMASGPIAEELNCYDAHMLDTGGLASGTRSIRLRIIERLLVNKFAGHSLDLRKLQASDTGRRIRLSGIHIWQAVFAGHGKSSYCPVAVEEKHLAHDREGS